MGAVADGGPRIPDAYILLGEHPRPWWFRLALALVPHRCREVPAPTDSGRVMIRQVALWYRHLYLMQFAGSEEPDWMHSHQWRWTLAVGLWGSYIERRLGERPRVRRAPYAYAMDHTVVHHVQWPTPGHTSLFLGLWRDDDLKHYYPTAPLEQGWRALPYERSWSEPQRVPWEQHIQKMVARI